MAIFYNPKADIENRLKQRDLIAELVPVIKQLNNGNPIPLFENFLICKAKLLFPPTVDTTTTTTTTAAGTANTGATAAGTATANSNPVATKCETEF